MKKTAGSDAGRWFFRGRISVRGRCAIRQSGRYFRRRRAPDQWHGLQHQTIKTLAAMVVDDVEKLPAHARLPELVDMGGHTVRALACGLRVEEGGDLVRHPDELVAFRHADLLSVAHAPPGAGHDAFRTGENFEFVAAHQRDQRHAGLLGRADGERRRRGNGDDEGAADDAAVFCTISTDTRLVTTTAPVLPS
jgi:hypothetical protein